jgi:hypothetical protein
MISKKPSDRSGRNQFGGASHRQHYDVGQKQAAATAEIDAKMQNLAASAAESKEIAEFA